MAEMGTEASELAPESGYSPGYRTAVLAAAVFVIVLIGLLGGLWITYHRAVGNAGMQTAKIARVVGAQTEQTFAVIEQLLTSAAPGMVKAAPTPTGLAPARTDARYPLVRQVLRLDRDGRLLAPGDGVIADDLAPRSTAIAAV